MNVAIAANSPLAQYLAGETVPSLPSTSSHSYFAPFVSELREDSSATSLTAALAFRATSAVVSNQRNARPKSPHGRAIGRNNHGCRSLLFTSAQLFASNLLLAKLSAYNIFPDHDAVLVDVTPVTRRWLIPQVVGQHRGRAGVAVVAVFVALATARAKLSDPAGASAYSPVWSLVCMVLAAVLVSMAAVEVLHQLLLARYTYAVLRLIKEVRLYWTALGDLQAAFRLGLDVVKRSELAARGYRLGRILPPIGRLEEASSVRDPHFELQCRRLRIRLRDINDAIERAGRAVASRSHLSPDVTAVRPTEDEDHRADVRATPSLLVTALGKRHQVSFLLVENALRDTLIADLVSLSCGRTGCDNQSFLSTVTAHAQTVRSLTTMMMPLASELSRYTARLHRASIVDKEAAVRSTVQANVVPADIAAVSRALTEFQASCETLRTLALTSQHDIEAYSETLETDTRLRARLARSRAQMGKLMQQLGRDWCLFERVVQAADPIEAACADDTESTINEVVVIGRDASGDDKRRAMETQRLAQQDAERDCLLVFTATSTGEKDFDLQSLLHQQQRSGADTTPVPSFMGELQAVLGRRKALPSAPTVEKRIGDDGSTVERRVQSSVDVSPTALHSPASRRSVDLQQLLQSRFTAQLTEEYFGGGESEDEAEVEAGEDTPNPGVLADIG